MGNFVAAVVVVADAAVDAKTEGIGEKEGILSK